jgi:hypothetical protein
MAKSGLRERIHARMWREWLTCVLRWGMEIVWKISDRGKFGEEEQVELIWTNQPLIAWIDADSIYINDFGIFDSFLVEIV